MTQTELANAAMLCGMGVMAVLIGLCLIRAVRGPRLTDRIVAVNMRHFSLISPFSMPC